MTRFPILKKFLHPYLPIAFVIICPAVIPVSFAQDSALTAQRPRKVFTAKSQEPDEVLRIDTDLVSVDCTVTDPEGRPVRNLTREDFKLFSYGVQQPVSFFHI